MPCSWRSWRPNIRAARHRCSRVIAQVHGTARFGRVAAAVVAVMYWVDNPHLAGRGNAVHHGDDRLQHILRQPVAGLGDVFGILFIWAGIASVIMALKFGKWVATIGAVIRIALIAFFTLTVLIYAGEHGLHGFGGGASKPTWLIFLAATPILIFNLEGFELPSAAAEEMVNPRRDVPFAILRSGIGWCCSTGCPSWRSCWCCRPPGCPSGGISLCRLISTLR